MKQLTSVTLVLSVMIGAVRADTTPLLIDPNNPAKPSPGVAPPKASASVPTVTVDAEAPALTPQTEIKVGRIQFVGGSRYSLPSLVGPFRPLIGKTVPLSKLLKLTSAITQRYRDDGYPLSFAFLPNNNFQNGTVTVVLVEGYIAHSQINSDSPQIAERVKRLAEKMMQEKPLSQRTFDRYSLLMTRTPAAKVEANAQLPANIYGAATMTVNAAQPRRWDVSSTLDSRKGQNLAMLNGSLSNITSWGDQLGLAVLVPLDKTARKNYVGMNYQQYLSDEGLQLQLKGSFYQEDPRSYTQLLQLTPDINVESRQKQTQYTGGVALNYPLVLERQRQLGISTELDYVDKHNDYRLRANGFGNTVDLSTVRQHVRYPAAELGINGYQEWEKVSASARVAMRQGINGAGADISPKDSADLSFTRWKGGFDGAWSMTDAWRLSTSWEGDWSNDSLPESERASFGALRYGRGYPDGEASGDYGYGGQLELRYIISRAESQWLATVQPYVLTDTARTRFNQSGLGEKKLASAAAGVMFGDNRHYTLSVEGARPLADKPSDSRDRDWRFSVTLTWNFNDLR